VNDGLTKELTAFSKVSYAPEGKSKTATLSQKSARSRAKLLAQNAL
jgi:hypothetical protein